MTGANRRPEPRIAGRKRRSAAFAPAVYALLVCAPASACAGGSEGDALWQALSAGTPSLSLRWRYEHVDDDQAPGGVPLKDAEASTVRAALGYRTGDFHGFGAFVQFEAIGAVGVDDYNDGSGTGNREFATVVDPEGVEVNEGYLSWRDGERFLIKAGRQEITYRDAPFHRFMGTVLWRQNWQTHDAVTAAYTPLPALTLRYGYLWNVNRIFGEDAPDPLSDFESDSHVVNLQYTGIPNLRLEAYAYLLDFDEGARFSSNTFGARGNGLYPLSPVWGLLYTLEYAHQEDAAGNPFSYSEDYVLGELGLKRTFGNAYVKAVTAKLSYELLGGSGRPNGAFVTVLGTNHAFQGWADRFVVTPDNGIEDLYLTTVAALGWGMQFIFSYHHLDADDGGFSYGEEFDLQLSKPFLKHYLLAAKAAIYDAERNPRNVAGPPSADATIVWLWGELSF